MPCWRWIKILWFGVCRRVNEYGLEWDDGKIDIDTSFKQNVVFFDFLHRLELFSTFDILKLDFFEAKIYAYSIERRRCVNNRIINLKDVRVSSNTRKNLKNGVSSACSIRILWNYHRI
jgi:hypothetical protein